MRSSRLLCTILTLVGAMALCACGSGGDAGIAGGVRAGPQSFALPFVPGGAGEVVVVGLKNVAGSDAPVWVTAYTAAGTVYAGGQQMLTVPARGELRLPLVQVLAAGAAGGWVAVETRDVNALDAAGVPTALPTSGYVLPYAHRSVGGSNGEADSLPGLAAREGGVRVTVTPDTDSVQVVNWSYAENGAGAVPQALDVTIRTYGADGVEVGAPTHAVVPARGSIEWTPVTTLGCVQIEPTNAAAAGVHYRYAAAARESGLQVHAESRYLEADTSHWPELLDLGFEVAFGEDSAGNVHDFGLLLCNASDSTETIVLQAIYRRGGLPLLTMPRSFTLAAGRSVYLRTTTRDSLGLQQNEISWFDDLFGDVFLSSGFQELTLFVQAAAGVDVSARHFDPAFGEFTMIQRAIPRTNRACIFDMPIQVTTSGGTRNYVSVTNTTGGDLLVPMRAFTPMLGTEYILDPILVPARSRLDWSPDGLIFREQPTDTVGAPVSYLRLDMVPVTGALFRGRTERRDASDLLLYLAPTITRD